ncbi:alkaline phosphatase family protein [Brevibacillus sp. DP1.3A]|uniref:alkaline phosphatase family protein n=1 Tax=Brevibacillus sp. DP1.3A TaxID=2738867 RepID=UPI00156AC82A|nr:alkaline phosphatase family protein [Brevibacillus sp. DP1.3A]UED76753.1 alkaline phosphatase family protein [Brevibacillus sp. DP1.3A]
MKSRFTYAILLLLTLSLTVISCKPDSASQIRQHSLKTQPSAERNESQKPVLLILIDSLMDKPLQEAIRQGRAPALGYLLANGRYYPQVVSSFPTMSVTIDSTLLTGTYANQHHVPGLSWFSNKEKRMIYYGYGPKEGLKIDQPQVLLDILHQLNLVQLNPHTKTIHEELAEKGKDSASINGIIWRGKTAHTLQIPRLVEFSTRLPGELNVTGPKLLSYAAFAQLDPNQKSEKRMWRKYGMNDEFSAQEINYLITNKKLPPLTITYFPENDMEVHRKGAATIEGIEKADKALQTVLDTFGSWDKAIKEARWIVMGDSAQSPVLDDRKAATIDLRSLLTDYQIAKISQPVTPTNQIVISTNERMAYIYALDSRIPLSDIASRLQREPKLDIIARKENKKIVVTAGKINRKFTYQPNGPFTDPYGQKWTFSGDPSLLDMTMNKNRITYGKYPDVLARLYGAMNSHEGRYVVVTVQPGHELITESSPTHIGGAAHGSLHELDSLVPLLVTGTTTGPKTLRIVDLKDWLLHLTTK